ncbi:MAG TPA: hypothetical protein VHZ81_03100 [Galbitalea sp.]|nr:hypothetical protein [Galbitalea sp.]
MERPDIPGAIRPVASGVVDSRKRNRGLLLGGIGVFLVGIALLVVAIVIFTRSA